ncbi:MAG: hypothetical protein JWO06_594 [Bacteroidota bacterium]|nr:hypothetical protein [Bacteroidota bacterium]
MKKILLGLLVVLMVLIGVLLFNTYTLKSKQLVTGKAGPRYFKEDLPAIHHLSDAIKIRTISYDDSLKMQDNTAIDTLFTFLHATYPAVFSSLNETVIAKKNLLLKWQGTDSTLSPVMLYAHMDVVPVEENTLSQWSHPPFGGELDNDRQTSDGQIWGRGALDDKGSLISIYEAINKLLKKGFTPKRTIYFASGSDEEIGGKNGAATIAKYCLDNHIHVSFLMDEGGMVSEGVVPNLKKPVALIGTSEKGYLTLELSVNIKGGHSSHPAKETSIDVLTNAVKKIHDNKFEAHFSQSVEEFLDYLGPEMPMPVKVVFANRWLFKSVIISQYTKTDEGNALVRTTGVTTVINGGGKENVIPNKVTAKVNFRILPGQTPAEVMAKMKSVINDDRVEIVAGEMTEPSGVTSSDAWGFKAIQKTSAEIFPDAYVAPFLMLGSTDSKHFSKVTDQTYRFFPARMDNDLLGTIHGIDERIKMPTYLEAIEFYQQLLINLQSEPK